MLLGIVSTSSFASLIGGGVHLKGVYVSTFVERVPEVFVSWRYAPGFHPGPLSGFSTGSAEAVMINLTFTSSLG